MVDLRPYQGEAVDRLRAAYCAGAGGALLELGTGAGKTVTAMAVVAGVWRGRGSVLWVAHRQELVQQARACAVEFGLQPAIDAGKLVFATVQGSAWRDLPLVPTVIVVDEGHRALAKSYLSIFAEYHVSFRLLLTGTAWRSDGGDFSRVAEVTVKGPTIGELTEQGYLVPACYWSVPGVDCSGLHVRRGEFVAGEVAAAFDRPQLVGDVAATYLRLAGDRRGVVFCAGVAHAEHVAAGLRDLGVAAVCVSGETRLHERASALHAHSLGLLQVLCNADLLVEGWDNPAVSAVSVARATASDIIWRQAVGRGLRPAQGKPDCVVIDHGGNCARLGLVDEVLQYESGSGGARGRSDGVSLLTCDACFAVLPSKPRPVTCPRCFAVLPVKAARKAEAVDGELVPFGGERAQGKAAMDWALWRKLDVERQSRGYRVGWTWARYNASKEAQSWAKA